MLLYSFELLTKCCQYIRNLSGVSFSCSIKQKRLILSVILRNLHRSSIVLLYYIIESQVKVLNLMITFQSTGKLIYKWKCSPSLIGLYLFDLSPFPFSILRLPTKLDCSWSHESERKIVLSIFRNYVHYQTSY